MINIDGFFVMMFCFWGVFGLLLLKFWKGRGDVRVGLCGVYLFVYVFGKIGGVCGRY